MRYETQRLYKVKGASLIAQLVRIHLQCGRPGFDPWVGEDPLEKGKASTKQHIVAYELASQEEYNAFPGSLMNGTASFQDAEMQNFLNTS